MQELLSATNNSNLLMINGMKLASLRAEGSDVLDLRGCAISRKITRMYVDLPMQGERCQI